MHPQKKFNTLEELKESYFPQKILEDLEEIIYKESFPSLLASHSCNKNKEDPTRGNICLNIPAYYFWDKAPKIEEIEEVIKKFYSQRGYKVKMDQGDSIIVKKGKINNKINILNTDTLYRIEVSKNSF